MHLKKDHAILWVFIWTAVISVGIYFAIQAGLLEVK